jgi:hypothetical protein
MTKEVENVKKAGDKPLIVQPLMAAKRKRGIAPLSDLKVRTS